MTLRSNSDSLRRATRMSLAGSLLVHLVCLSVLAIGLPLTPHFKAGNSADRTQLALELKESTQRRVAANNGSARPVVIKPYSATVEGQRMVATPASKVRLEELLGTTKSATAIRKHLPPSAAGDRTGEVNVRAVLDFHPIAKRNKAAQLTSNDTVDQSGKSKTTRKRHKREFKVAGKAPAIPPDFSSSRRPYNNQPPTYPSLAIERGWIGTVVLQLSVDRTGKVTRVKVYRSSGYRLLDAAAVSAIRHWRGKPAMKDGQTMATVCNIPIQFAQ